MEVHPHTHTPRKKFTHYLWEFLMLFLAVFCGFLAENQREHIVEHKKEKEFILSICQDLKFDTALLNDLTKLRQEQKTKTDSLLYYLNMQDPDTYGKFIYYYARPLTNRAIFYSNDRTIQQLKNAGNLRLIRHQDASDSIMEYDWQVRRNEHIKEREEAFILEYIETIKQLFDGNEFEKMMTSSPRNWKWPSGNPHLLHKDKESIQKLINDLHFMKTINVLSIGWNKDMIDRALRLLILLKKEYHLQ